MFCSNLAGIYLFKANNENTRAMCKICSELIIKTLERRQVRKRLVSLSVIQAQKGNAVQLGLLKCTKFYVMTDN